MSNVEFISVGTGARETISRELTQRLEYTGTTLLYLGDAAPGSATSDPVWRIRKYTVDGNSMVTKVEFAEGNGNFDNIWNNRATLSYS